MLLSLVEYKTGRRYKGGASRAATTGTNDKGMH